MSPPPLYLPLWPCLFAHLWSVPCGWPGAVLCWPWPVPPRVVSDLHLPGPTDGFLHSSDLPEGHSKFYNYPSDFSFFFGLWHSSLLVFNSQISDLLCWHLPSKLSKILSSLTLRGLTHTHGSHGHFRDDDGTLSWMSPSSFRSACPTARKMSLHHHHQCAANTKD